MPPYGWTTHYNNFHPKLDQVIMISWHILVAMVTQEFAPLRCKANSNKYWTHSTWWPDCQKHPTFRSPCYWPAFDVLLGSLIGTNMTASCPRIMRSQMPSLPVLLHTLKWEMGCCSFLRSSTCTMTHSWTSRASSQIFLCSLSPQHEFRPPFPKGSED